MNTTYLKSYTREKSPLAGKTVRVVSGNFVGDKFVVEDYACNVFGRYDWLSVFNNPSVFEFLMTHEYRPDNKSTALYGKIGPYGHILREDEVAE